MSEPSVVARYIGANGITVVSNAEAIPSSEELKAVALSAFETNLRKEFRMFLEDLNGRKAKDSVARFVAHARLRKMPSTDDSMNFMQAMKSYILAMLPRLVTSKFHHTFGITISTEFVATFIVDLKEAAASAVVESSEARK